MSNNDLDDIKNEIQQLIDSNLIKRVIKGTTSTTITLDGNETHVCICAVNENPSALATMSRTLSNLTVLSEQQSPTNSNNRGCFIQGVYSGFAGSSITITANSNISILAITLCTKKVITGLSKNYYYHATTTTDRFADELDNEKIVILIGSVSAYRSGSIIDSSVYSEVFSKADNASTTNKALAHISIGKSKSLNLALTNDNDTTVYPRYSAYLAVYLE